MGEIHNTYVTLGASNHSKDDREENDFYATPPKAVDLLFELESFDKHIWEPAAGMKHIAQKFLDKGYDVRCSDIIDRTGDIEICDFLKSNEIWNGDIVTNPPFKFAKEFVEKALETVTEGHKVVMFLKLQFLETEKRRKLFDKYPIKTIYVASNRLGCAKGGDFDGQDNIGSAVCYCWYVWEKGYTGDTKLRFFN